MTISIINMQVQSEALHDGCVVSTGNTGLERYRNLPIKCGAESGPGAVTAHYHCQRISKFSSQYSK
jgi:hypothetical protein